MIFLQTKRYQLSLWADAEQKGTALHLEFDKRENAERAFADHKVKGQYHHGILFEWRKQENDWVLLSRFPD
jgi:hypothetical protein